MTDESADRYSELILQEGSRQAVAERLRQTSAGSASKQIARARQPTLTL